MTVARDPRGAHRWRRFPDLLVQLGASLGLYLLFAARLDWRELLIGTVVAALATAGTRAVLREHAARFSARPRWIAQAWRLPKYVLTGTWETFRVLARHLFTSEKAPLLLREAPFDVGGDDDASATRRALATAYTTITPNFVVLGFDRARRRMIFYQIARSPVPEMTARLGAER